MVQSLVTEAVMAELLTLIRVTRHDSGHSERWPSDTEIMELLKTLGVANQVHASLAELRYAMAREAARMALYRTPHQYSGGREQAIGDPLVGRSVAHRPSGGCLPGASEAVLVEARVKSMPYKELEALCERHGIKYQKEAPNAGIKTMRARNAVYSALRRGVPIIL